jgi:hypothetical protein
MHASVSFVNGAGTRRRSSGSRSEREELRLLNTLLSAATPESSRPDAPESSRPDADAGKSVDKSKPKDERQAEEESRADPISKPGGFKNDPKDPTNPNEVRERHLKKIKR